MTLKNTGTLVAVCAVLAAGTVGAQSKLPTKLDETALTLSGCVVRGDRPDSYLIRDVKVAGAGAAIAPTGAYYRLDTTKGLQPHVNHQVEISGHADLADHDKGRLTTKTDAAGQGTTAVSSERRTVTAKDAPVFAGTVGTETSVKTVVDTYGFKVDTIRMVSSSCS